MIETMAKTGEPEWSVYILRCHGDTLYTGIAKDVEARFKRHQTGKGAAYTKMHAPQCVVYLEAGLTRSEALVREARLKRWPKLKKETVIASPIRYVKGPAQ